MVDKKIDTGKIFNPVMMGVLMIGGIAVLSNIYNVVTSILSGIVYDIYGNGVEGVTVNLNGASKMTDVDGVYSFRTTPGSKIISFSKEGYYPISRTIELTIGSETIFNAPMVETIIDPTGTVLCLPMSEGVGQYAMDVSGYGNDALLGGGDLERAPNWEILPNGLRVLSYDGNNDYVDLGIGNSLSFADLEPWSIAMWIKAKDIDTPIGHFRVLTQSTSGADPMLLIYPGALAFYRPGPYQLTRAWALGNFEDVWAHIVFTTDASRNMRVYRDGIYKTVLALNSSQIVFRYLGRVSPYHGNTWYKRSMRGVRIYERSLGADEVAQLFGSS